jgi:integrase
MLTETQLKRLPAPGKDQLVGLGDCLYLRIRTTGRKTFIIRRRVGDKMTSTTVGDWPQWSIQRARAAALAPTKVLAERIRFGEAAGRFIEDMLEARYRGDTTKYAASFTRDAAGLYSTPLHRITRAQLVDLVTKKAATSPSAARKQLVMYKKFTKWAALHELIAGDILSPVTAGGIGLADAGARDRVLTDDEIKFVLRGEGKWWPLMRLCLTTAARVGEAMQIDDDQIDGNLWTLPITKNGKPHSLWLTNLAKQQIAGGWSRVHYATINRWLSEDVGVTWRPHDLRRTGATLMRSAGVSVEDVETVLNHSPGRLVQVYQRHDNMPAIRSALEKLEQALKSYI